MSCPSRNRCVYVTSEPSRLKLGTLKSGMPNPAAVRSKAWVYGRSLGGIVGSSPAGSMDVCLLSVVCCVVRGLCVAMVTRPEKSFRV